MHSKRLKELSIVQQWHEYSEKCQNATEFHISHQNLNDVPEAGRCDALREAIILQTCRGKGSGGKGNTFDADPDEVDA